MLLSHHRLCPNVAAHRPAGHGHQHRGIPTRPPLPAKRTLKQDGAYLRINFFVYNWLSSHPFHSCSKSKRGQLKKQRDHVHHTETVSASKPFLSTRSHVGSTICVQTFTYPNFSPSDLDAVLSLKSSEPLYPAPRWSSHLGGL